MTTLITNSQFKQFDSNGEPLAGGLIYTYIVGTTTDKVTYQDEDNLVPHTNPIVLDSWGEATIWISGDTRFYITDADGAEIRNYPSFDDGGAGSTPEYPVNPSPGGGILRSTATETGYIKVQLPMGEWPDTKLSFDLIIYDDASNESQKMSLSGYANSTLTSWENTTAISNGTTGYAVQFGNDGIYPAIYIGAVDSEWDKPQIAIVNFLAGEFSYTWADWNNGWVISITTSLGTITDTPTLIKNYPIAGDAKTIAGTDTDSMTTPANIQAKAADDTEAIAGTSATKFMTPASNAAHFADKIAPSHLLTTDTVEAIAADFAAPAGYSFNGIFSSGVIVVNSVSATGDSVNVSAGGTVVGVQFFWIKRG